MLFVCYVFVICLLFAVRLLSFVCFDCWFWANLHLRGSATNHTKQATNKQCSLVPLSTAAR